MLIKGNYIVRNVNQILNLLLKMKYILTQENVAIPDGVEVNVKARQVEVKGMNIFIYHLGPLGILKRSFKCASVDIQKQTHKKRKTRLAL